MSLSLSPFIVPGSPSSPPKLSRTKKKNFPRPKTTLVSIVSFPSPRKKLLIKLIDLGSQCIYYVSRPLKTWGPEQKKKIYCEKKKEKKIHRVGGSL